MKANDIYTLLSMIARPHKDETLEEWHIRTGLSISSIHRSLKYLKKVKLVIETVESNEPMYKNMEEFILHGFPYVFPEEKGGLTRGFITGIDATVLKNEFVSADYPAVWAHHQGNVKGFAVKPLHKEIPELIASGVMDSKLYELLALLDVLRIGQRREIESAQKRIKSILDGYE